MNFSVLQVKSRKKVFHCCKECLLTHHLYPGPGELNIQSIPSEVELVTETGNNNKNNELHQPGVSTSAGDSSLSQTHHIHKHSSGTIERSCVKTEVASGDRSGQTMLWKRIRHTVVFGGKVNKNKKDKD